MDFRHIRTERIDEVSRITLARPEKLNALDAPLLNELCRAIKEAPRGGARAMILTGEGRGFSSGADLTADGAMPDDLGETLDRTYHPVLAAMSASPIPIVAAVNGPAAGAGCSLALAADMVIAGRSAYFAMAFVRIGLIPDAGATWVLPRLVGRARALEMMLLGEAIPAEQAVEWGLISRMVEDERLEHDALALAERLASGPTKAFGLIRRLARDAAHLPLEHALAAEQAAQTEAGRTDDFRRAVMAFAAKQAPEFRGA